MSATEEFLKSLSDTELAFLIKYKSITYLPESQKKILLEVENRNLNAEQLEELIRQTENNPANTGCPRCNSMKTTTEKIEFYRRDVAMDDAMGHPRSFYNEICLICGSFIKGNSKNEID